MGPLDPKTLGFSNTMSSLKSLHPLVCKGFDNVKLLSRQHLFTLQGWGEGGGGRKANVCFLPLTILCYHSPNCKPWKWNLLSLCLLNPKISYRHLTEISSRYYGPSPIRTLTRGPSLSAIKGVNFYGFLILASLSAVPLILHEWLLMITLINNSEKVVPDLHASMNLNRFNMSFYCDDFFDKEIKWVKLLIIAWVARGMRMQKCFLLAERQGIFFFPFFLQLYSQIHSLGISEVFVFSLVWQIPLCSQATKKAPSVKWIPVKWWVYQGDFSHWEAFIPRDFVWLNSPHMGKLSILLYPFYNSSG